MRNRCTFLLSALVMMSCYPDPELRANVFQFAAEQDLVTKGKSTRLRAVYRGMYATIEPGGSEVYSGSFVEVYPSESTIYTLHVIGEDGVEVTARASVRVVGSVLE
jgi:hypothetical protein